jgi:hypothetical protein
MLNLYSSLRVRDHISYPYKTMGKITERLQEDKIDSEKNDKKKSVALQALTNLGPAEQLSLAV